jgi:ElaA protein
MSKLAYRCVSFSELNLWEWHDIVRLRTDVFVVEQECPYPEIDGQDEKSQHLLGYFAGGLNAYARIVPPSENGDNFHVGRVVVRKGFRGIGLGREVMGYCLQWIQAQGTAAGIHVQAQTHLMDWYNSMGFRKLAGPYDWDGISHVDMEFKDG